jgi:prepilin-type processing-associated H-X9-DG protein/prepilin-type N-terminal cleavage/methylation domain-containing protein
MRYRKKTFFTLIELLIVIAIIAILASMLLPALKRARMSAKSLACINLQKNVGAASVLYADDWNGWLLVPSSPNFGCSRIYWLKQIAPYWGGDGRYDSEVSSSWSKLCSQKIIACPVTPNEILYGRNENTGFSPFGQPNGYTQYSLKDFQKPSCKIIFGDTYDYYDDPTYWVNNYLYSSPDYIGDRHNNGINVLFADNHVSWHRRNYLQNHTELYPDN